VRRRGWASNTFKIQDMHGQQANNYSMVPSSRLPRRQPAQRE
jgi:hypothetical protein